MAFASLFPFVVNLMQTLLRLFSCLLLKCWPCPGCALFHKIMGLSLFFKPIVNVKEGRFNPVLLNRKE